MSRTHPHVTKTLPCGGKPHLATGRHASILNRVQVCPISYELQDEGEGGGAHEVKVAMESRKSLAAPARSLVAMRYVASYTLRRFLRSQSPPLTTSSSAAFSPAFTACQSSYAISSLRQEIPVRSDVLALPVSKNPAKKLTMALGNIPHPPRIYLTWALRLQEININH